MCRINLNLNAVTSTCAAHRRECRSAASSTWPCPGPSSKLASTECHGLKSVEPTETAPVFSDRCRVSAHLDLFEKLYSFLLRKVINLKLLIFGAKMK